MIGSRARPSLRRRHRSGCLLACRHLVVAAQPLIHATARAGQRLAGVFAGLFSAGQGLGFAVGPLLFGLVLQVAGYVPSTTGVAATQSAATSTAVLLGFAVLPAAVTGLSLLAVRRIRS
ncbi:MAG: MFS transporter [Actinomycetia bacterium]|nr:MFS transporter [Actinomycetes bacterium]